MDTMYYEKLYQLQDDVLNLVFREPYGFYLTGGTALSRFYFNHRYSDDLDFFHSDCAVFPDAFRLMLRSFRERWPDITLEVDAKDFKRLWLKVQNTILKIDFVADRVPRIGIPAVKGSFRVDTVRNILSNKVCAILGRDEEKDVVDLIWISKKRQFFWPTVLADAQTKELFTQEELIYRLSTFPIELLKKVHFVQEVDCNYFDHALQVIIQDIQAGTDNHLAEKPLSIPLE
ncbi:MAG: nucleotidyl transferase AbiEii/AbiGii toxin family protein [Spirochaetota bacterium]|jgi:predicted nucleotidyltransferase component of viral defense system